MPFVESSPPIPQVLCLGEVLEDCLTRHQHRQCFLGGAPANVAAGLVKLGTPAAFIGAIGTDGIGARIEAQLRGLGINLTGLQRIANYPTRQVEVAHLESGDRQFVGFSPGDVSTFADAMLQAPMLPQKLFPQAQFLVLGTLGFASPVTATAIREAVTLAQAHQVKILVDVNWRPIFWADPNAAKSVILDLLAQATVIKLAAEEAEWLFGSADVQVVFQSAPGQPGLVVITDGEQGCQYASATQSGALPAFAVSVVDTTGAGDGFVAGLLHCLVQAPDGQSHLDDPAWLKETMRYASAVGAMVTQAPGAIAPQPDADAVQDFLNRHPA